MVLSLDGSSRSLLPSFSRLTLNDYGKSNDDLARKDQKRVRDDIKYDKFREVNRVTFEYSQ